ncbi:MAG: hypothetical protein ACP5HU_03350 [Phycisphaerae bacterium]
MLTKRELHRRRRRIYMLAGLFLGLSIFLCTGFYFGWFGWFVWGRAPSPPREVVAEGSEAERFARRLKETQAKLARDDIEKLREQLDQLNLVMDSRYRRYSQEFRHRNDRPPEPLTNLEVAEPSPAEAEAATSDIDGKGILELYETARLLDKRMHDVYRVFRTCELARIQQMTLRDAYNATDVVAPTHPDPDYELFSRPITSTAGEDMKRLKQELETIRVQIRSMVGNGRRMLDMAAILEPELLGYGSEWDFGRAEGRMYQTTAVMERPPQLFQGQTGSDPQAFEHEWGRGEGPVTKRELGLPVDLGIDLSDSIPLPGRKLLREGWKQEWMFINAWYVIGPFPSPDREGITKKFPPEASIDPHLGFVGIDLDATYVGMEDKPVRWEYLATDRRVCFIPHQPAEWAIWYAYTEIYCEDEQERWVIFGSDDWGKCWINGEEVYDSGVTPHPWVPDRAYAKVSFQQGVNTVLFKLENAWGRTGFSLCVYTGEVADGHE